MSYPDLINGLFELSGGFFILKSIFKLNKDKKVRGIHWSQAAFFMAWGYWNLYYYPYLEQWVSFIGGIGVVTTNTFWLGQMIYYLRKENKGMIK
jgi:hypothetical protein